MILPSKLLAQNRETGQYGLVFRVEGEHAFVEVVGSFLPRRWPVSQVDVPVIAGRATLRQVIEGATIENQES